jgi:uncharacterized membrane protein
MKYSAGARANNAMFLAVLALSAVTMIWLFWHYPVKTCIGTIVVLVGLGVSARLARAVDTEAVKASDLDQRKQSV